MKNKKLWESSVNFGPFEIWGAEDGQTLVVTRKGELIIDQAGNIIRDEVGAEKREGRVYLTLDEGGKTYILEVEVEGGDDGSEVIVRIYDNLIDPPLLGMGFIYR